MISFFQGKIHWYYHFRVTSKFYCICPSVLSSLLYWHYLFCCSGSVPHEFWPISCKLLPIVLLSLSVFRRLGVTIFSTCHFCNDCTYSQLRYRFNFCLQLFILIIYVLLLRISRSLTTRRTVKRIFWNHWSSTVGLQSFNFKTNLGNWRGLVFLYWTEYSSMP